ncbi:MAG: DUF4139 domain-containing protein [Desulfovibrionaceae bacterium]
MTTIPHPFRAVLIPLVAVALCLGLGAAPARAADETKSLGLTVYNNGRAMVNETRAMDIPKGRSRVEFLGVPETIEAASLRAASRTVPDALRLLDMNFEYDLVSTQTLLDRYVGKSLKVVLPDPVDAQAKVVRDATLLANNGQPVFQIASGATSSIYVGPYESVLLPELPHGLRATPALVWLVDNAGPVRHDVDVSYLAGNISWRTDYVLTLAPGETAASLAGWVTLTNESGMAFADATLKLVAGDVHRAAPPRPKYNRLIMADAASMSQEAREESFFEYHLYTIDRPVTVANRQTKQIALLTAPHAAVAKHLTATYADLPHPSNPGPLKQSVAVSLELANTTKNGLGLPLPKGIVRAYGLAADGQPLLIGEDDMDHTPVDGAITLNLGTSFDLGVERTLAAYDHPGKNVVEYTWEITLKNGGKAPRTVRLDEVMPGQWTITKASHGFDRRNAGTARFTITVPPTEGKNPVVVTYSARLTL